MNELNNLKLKIYMKNIHILSSWLLQNHFHITNASWFVLYR